MNKMMNTVCSVVDYNRLGKNGGGEGGTGRIRNHRGRHVLLFFPASSSGKQAGKILIIMFPRELFMAE